MIKKRVASLFALAAIGVVGLIGGSPAQAPGSANGLAQASKTCGHGMPAQTPGGVKCLASGEYCSHKSGYAAAHRNAGFRCAADSRLVER